MYMNCFIWLAINYARIITHVHYVVALVSIAVGKQYCECDEVINQTCRQVVWIVAMFLHMAAE